MPNDKIAAVGANIVEKAAMIWNVADMLRGHIEHKNGGRLAYSPDHMVHHNAPPFVFASQGHKKGRDAQNIPA